MSDSEAKSAFPNPLAPQGVYPVQVGQGYKQHMCPAAEPDTFFNSSMQQK